MLLRKKYFLGSGSGQEQEMGATLNVPGTPKYRKTDEHIPVPGPWRLVGCKDIDAQAVRCSDVEQVLSVVMDSTWEDPGHF